MKELEAHPAYSVALREVCNILPMGSVFKESISAEDVRTQMIVMFLMGVTWAAQQQNDAEG